jgi:copper oxidase (laccase) domain-containing protein
MKWRLTSKGQIRYFEFAHGKHSAIYTTKHGQDDLIRDLTPIFSKQIHSKIIVDIDSAEEVTGDGVLSSTSQCIGVKVADCLPVYLFAQGKTCVIHCGWRGIIEGIAKEAKKILHDFHYVLGASIGPCCYEVQHDVAKLFLDNHPNAVRQRSGKYFIDLRVAVTNDLGTEFLIGRLDLCTKCHAEYFYSHRLGDEQRNYALIVNNATGN